MVSGDLAIKLISVIFSLLLIIGCVLIAIKLIHHVNQMETINKSKSAAHYFIMTSEATLICNILCCVSVSMYCIWIVFDHTHNLEWFIALRAATTVCWFAAKVALMWLFNGRLYYAFINSPFELPRSWFIAFNASTSIVAPLCIILGYVGVWNGLSWLILLGFQGFRFIYLFLATLLLSMFSKRLLTLQKLVIENAEKDVKTDANVQHQNLLDIATKNAVLTMFMSISASFVAASWLIHDYGLAQSYLTLLIPFLMFAVDSLLNSCFVLLLFQFAGDLYAKLCIKCDGRCRRLYIRTELQAIAANINLGSNGSSCATSNDHTKKANDLSTPNVSTNASTTGSKEKESFGISIR